MTVPRHDQHFLHEILNYLPETGELWWKERPPSMFAANNRAIGPVANPQQWSADRWNKRFADKRAFTAVTPAGYHFGAIKPGVYLASRIIWTWMTGEWPDPTVDHVNGVRTDDRWGNLRLATKAQQLQNRLSRPRKLPRGVYPNGRAYRAQIKVDGVLFHLGTFSTPGEAHAAYCKAAETLHGEFAFHRSRRP